MLQVRNACICGLLANDLALLLAECALALLLNFLRKWLEPIDEMLYRKEHLFLVSRAELGDALLLCLALGCGLGVLCLQ